MKVDIEALNATERKLRIEVPADHVAQTFSRVYSRLGRQARVKGFRPGKIPRQVLKGLYGNEIQGQVLSELVENVLGGILEEKGLAVVSRPQLETAELKEGEPFSFTAFLEVKPEIELKDYRGVEVQRVKLEVTDEQVETALSQLQDRHAQLEPVEGRDLVTEGDFIFVDYTGTVEGKPFPGSKAENFAVEVGSGRSMVEFERGCVGLRRDVPGEFSVTLPDNYPADEFAGKVAEFRVVVKDIRRKHRPEIDDEFARDVSDCAGLAELKDTIRTELARELDELQSRQLKDQILKSLVDRHSFEVGRSLVEREVRYLAERETAAADPARGENRTREELREQLEPEARRRVKAMLLIEKISAAENIEAPEEEVNHRIERMVRSAGERAQTVREFYRREDAREELRSQIVSEKTLEFLLEHAKISEARAPIEA